MNRGFLIVAQNNGVIDYIKCATVLADSIKNVMPDASVTLLTDKKIKAKPFDGVVTFPHGDYCKDISWKLNNDWQIYDASPYEYTIKIEADMYLPRSIEYWWDILSNRDLVLCTSIRNYKNEISTSKMYRKIFIDNLLPDTYSAITYFKRSQNAEKFFNIVKDIFLNWESYKSLLKCSDSEIATTDVAYAIAAKILGVENCIMPGFKEMSFIHMKQGIIGTTMSDWSRELVYEISRNSFRIGTIPAMYPVHYHNKSFAFKIEDEL